MTEITFESITCGAGGADDHWATPLFATHCDCGAKTIEEVWEEKLGTISPPFTKNRVR